MAPFIKLERSPLTDDLLRHPGAFALLTLIALRARRTDERRLDGLQVGQAQVGDYAAVGLTRQQFRTAISNLQKWGFITTQATNKGTTATLTEIAPYDINSVSAQPTGQPASNQPANQQPTSSQPLTRMKEGKEEKEERVGADAPAADAASVPAAMKEVDAAPFALFWEAYGKKRGDKAKAVKRWGSLKLAERLSILNGLDDYKRQTPDPQYRPDPITFLNQQRWQAEGWNQPLPAAAPKPIPYAAPPSTAPQFASRAEVDALWDDPIPTGYANTSFR
jgi:hypothetical protein